MKKPVTIALIAYFAIMITASVLVNQNSNEEEPCITDSDTIVQAPLDLDAIPYTDSTGHTWIIYR